MNRFLFATCMVLLVSCAEVPVEKPADEGQQELKLGLALLSNVEVNDKSEALVSFEQACDLGNNYGCHKVGIAYNNGLYGREKDYQKAMEWYLKAAIKGYVPSQQNIANLYAHRFISANDTKGYMWLKLAETGTAKCLAGSIEVDSDTPEMERRRLCNLASAGQGRIRSIFRQRMTAEEIQQAEGQARAWRPL